MVDISIDGSSLFRPIDLVEGSPFAAPSALRQGLGSMAPLSGDDIPHINSIGAGVRPQLTSSGLMPQLSFLPKNYQPSIHNFESSLFQNPPRRPFDNAKFDSKILGGLVGVIGESHGPSVDLSPLGRGNFLLIGPGITYFRSSPMDPPGKSPSPLSLSFVSTSGFNSLEFGLGKAYVRPTPGFPDTENLTWWNVRTNPSAVLGENMSTSFNFGGALSVSDMPVNGIGRMFGSKGRALADFLNDIGAKQMNIWAGLGGRASVTSDQHGNLLRMKIGSAEFDVTGYTPSELALASGQKLLEGLSSPRTFFNIQEYEPPARGSKAERWLYGRDMPFSF